MKTLKTGNVERKRIRKSSVRAGVHNIDAASNRVLDLTQER